MKNIKFRYYILFIFLVNIFTIYSQEITPSIDTCFTTEQIKNIYYEIKYLKENESLCDSIIIEHNNQKVLFKNIIYLDSIKYNNQLLINKVLEENNNILKERILELEPKWYDDKTLWFGLGIILTLFGQSL
ncbi:MAG: hypothetical protein ACOVNU_08015 [Candidatus Kapaibacteriota bacterium]|jgi:hypothetical protein